MLCIQAMPVPFWCSWAGDGLYILFASHQNSDWPNLLPAIIKTMTGLPWRIKTVIFHHLPPSVTKMVIIGAGIKTVTEERPVGG